MVAQDLSSEQKKKWLSFLNFFQLKPQNNQLLRQYFFYESRRHPEDFYEFMKDVKTWLKKKGTPKDKSILARKYIEVLSPICARFGFFHEKSELDDICLSIIDPKKYRRIQEHLQDYKKSSQSIIQKILKKFRSVIKEGGFDAKITGRFKNIYSIYKKMKKYPGKDLWRLKDIFAFRIVLDSSLKEDCFELLNILHDRFFPIPRSFKDYISIPKINGYQSLHTGLQQILPELDIPIEVQIRTKSMDEFAEKGVAAHWLYSQKKQSSLLTETEQRLLKSLHAQEEGTFLGEVFFFSFEGNLFHMPQGSRIIDFAYFLHTEIGNCLSQALVNQKTVEFDYEIQEGDIIELKKSPRKTVTPRWLDYTSDKFTHKKIHANV